MMAMAMMMVVMLLFLVAAVTGLAAVHLIIFRDFYMVQP